MIEDLIQMYLTYAEEIVKGGDIPPPPLTAQVALKEINEEEFLNLDKSTITLKEFNEYKKNPDVIPTIIEKYNESQLDLTVLSITFFVAKYGKGKFYDKLDLLIKLVSKPFDVEKQINLTEAGNWYEY